LLPVLIHTSILSSGAARTAESSLRSQEQKNSLLCHIDYDNSIAMPAELHLAPARQVLARAIEEKTFPGAAFGVLSAGTTHTGALGHFTYTPGSPAVTPETIYDIASLTKIVATTSMAMILFDRHQLDPATPLETILPAFNPGHDIARKKVTLYMLLAHSSGLPAHEYLDKRCRTRDEALTACLAMPLAHEPGTTTVYSDIGFILLGLALEAIIHEPIATFCTREVFQPLGMAGTLFNPPPSLRAHIAPTQNTPHQIQGTVRDENAALLEGVAGHAGLFSNVPDLLRFAQCILNNGEGLFKPATIALFATRAFSPADTSRALGWDTPSEPSSSGRFFSPHSIGHLGYTGTSLWLDLDRALAVVLLTNRTWPDHGTPQAAHLPDRQEPIRRLRPAFHDAILQALFASSASATRSD
jgi:CubicO group peptidase (beta-lactamase class C family)